jgi:hypothetical protein
MLAQTEKPAAILQRRLQQAGYDLSDELDTTGQDELTFLIKFVYKSILLGPAVRVFLANTTPDTSSLTRSPITSKYV